MSQPVLGDLIEYHKQVVNRLKIPQGLSTLLFRWSEVPSRGGVKFLQGEGSAVIHRKKNYLLLQRYHLSVSQPLAG